MVEFRRPYERVIFWHQRDANPTFHLFESLWMLAGRNDVSPLSYIVKGMSNFSDDGETFNGAYGHRWVHHFGTNQLIKIAVDLKESPDSRRQVLSMWDGHHDLGLDSKDLPCNTHIYFSRNMEGALEMTVCNRSNDLVWGMLGANVVHFSVLHEFMAAAVGCKMGSYYHFTNNLHLYLDRHEEMMEAFARDVPYYDDVWCPYESGKVTAYPLVKRVDIPNWIDENNFFVDTLGETPIGMNSMFHKKVAGPLMRAYEYYKDRDLCGAQSLCNDCQATDWQGAAIDWYERRINRSQV